MTSSKLQQIETVNERKDEKNCLHGIVQQSLLNYLVRIFNEY